MDLNDGSLATYFPSIYAHVIVAGATTASQLFMCTYCAYIFMQQSEEVRRRRRLYIGSSLAIFFFDCFANICIMKFDFNMLTRPKTFLEGVNLEIELSQEWYVIAANWATLVVFLGGDALLVYRCFIVWTGRRIVTVLPIVLYIVVFALLLWADIVSVGSLSFPKVLVEVTYSMSAVLNCIVTLLIGGKLWFMHRRNSRILVQSDSKIYLGVFGIVAESALPFALAGISLAVCYDQGHTHPSSWKAWEIAENVSDIIWDALRVLSPQLIIWRVALGHSFAHSTNETSKLTTLAFGHNTVNHLSHASDLENASSLEVGRGENNSMEKVGTEQPQNDIEAV